MTEFECLIVADDLTGACDAAVAFACHGQTTSVLLATDAPTGAANVVAVSTESRNLDAGDAAAAVACVARRLRGRLLFKKIDSVLRGHPAEEISAALSAFAYEAAVATPAFPAMGRVVNAANATQVARKLNSEIHTRPEDVQAALSAGSRIVSVNAETDHDLDRIASAGAGRQILWAGSGGLAWALARQRGGDICHPDAPKAGRIVFCVGSDHPVTVQQVSQLLRIRPDCMVLSLEEGLSAHKMEALFLSGGDTASSICRAHGVYRIDLLGEVLPGIPWGYLRGGALDGVPVVTKSGGFGAPDALLRVREFFE